MAPTDTSPASIVNDGLLLVGEGEVTSSFLTAPQGELERVCSVAYPKARDAMLRENIWGFSKTRAQLAASAIAPLFDWERAFPLPGDFVRFVKLDAAKEWVPIDGVDYTIESHPAPTQVTNGETVARAILTNYDAPLKIVYCRRVTNVNLMDILFQQALGARVAMVVAKRITEESDAFTLARGQYQSRLDMADLTDAIEQPPEEFTEDDFIAVRG